MVAAGRALYGINDVIGKGVRGHVTYLSTSWDMYDAGFLLDMLARFTWNPCCRLGKHGGLGASCRLKIVL